MSHSVEKSSFEGSRVGAVYSKRRPRFNPNWLYLKLLVNEVALEKAFPRVIFGFLLIPINTTFVDVNP
jgi:hypothetical protein